MKKIPDEEGTFICYKPTSLTDLFSSYFKLLCCEHHKVKIKVRNNTKMVLPLVLKIEKELECFEYDIIKEDRKIRIENKRQNGPRSQR